MNHPRLPLFRLLIGLWTTLALAGCATSPAASSSSPAATATPTTAVASPTVTSQAPAVAEAINPPSVSATAAPSLGPTPPNTNGNTTTALIGPTPPAADAENTALVPVPQGGRNYQTVHQRLVEQAHSGNIDVLFLGDSITDFWTGVSSGRATGKAVWDEYFAPLKAANFGYSADRTQHVLWRLRNGEGEGFQPKVIVLMIGTNNTGNERNSDRLRNTVPQTIEGVTAVVHELRARFPKAKILLLAIFPRGDFALNNQQIAQINPELAKLDDDANVFYLDIGQKFLAPDGTIPTDIMADHLHPTAKGYEIWAEAIKTPLNDLLRRWNAENPAAK